MKALGWALLPSLWDGTLIARIPTALLPVLPARQGANIKLIAGELEKQYPLNRGQGGAVMSLTGIVIGRIRPILIVLLCGAGLLLLIACVNVTSLVLVRAESRRREMAVRSATQSTG